MKTSNLIHSATRVGNQRARIHQGVKSGELTKHEANRLKHGEKRVEKQIAKALADDGFIDAKEAAKIDRMQDRLSGKIAKNKHDAQNNKTPLADKRADSLQGRIDKGVESGALTEKEAARLNSRVDAFEQATADAKADGKVTRHERKELNRMANRISVGVAIQKHDRQKV